MTQTTRRSTHPVTPLRRTAPLALSASAAVLSVGVAVIHVIDQGGFPGSKDPSYLGLGYYLLEVSAVIVAALLLLPRTRASIATWTLAVGVGLGPVAGYCLSRGPGLPNYTDDIGNWTETLGVISLVIEVLLIVVAIAGARKIATKR